MKTNDVSADITSKSPEFSWWKRVGWLIIIWSLSVLSLGAVAFIIKKFMTAAGMTS